LPILDFFVVWGTIEQIRVAFRINRNLSLSLFGMQVQQLSVSQEGKLESYDHKPDLLLIRTTGGYSVNFSD